MDTTEDPNKQIDICHQACNKSYGEKQNSKRFFSESNSIYFMISKIMHF